MAPPSKKPNIVSYSSMELVLHNSDLLREILLRLPAESLIKLQSVCKEWLSLISSAEFGQQHTIRCLKLQQQSLILQSAVDFPQWPRHLTIPMTSSGHPILPDDDDDDDDPHGHVIVQSSNGLLLLRPSYCKRDDYLYVHNPATKQSRKIILTPSTTHPRVEEVALAFDPSKSPYYQLVCIRRSPYIAPEAVTYRIEVYDSESHTWNRNVSLGPFTLPTLMGLNAIRCSSPVYWNNAIYWSSRAGPFWRSETEPFYCCFDLATRELKALSPPTDHLDHHIENEHDYWESHYKNLDWRLQESNGHLLHVEFMGSEGGRESVTVWELVGDDDHHHWLLRHHHVLPPPPQWMENWNYSSILTFLVNSCSLVICWNGFISFYSLASRRYEDFLDETGQPFFDKYSRVFHFGGTLALV